MPLPFRVRSRNLQEASPSQRQEPAAIENAQPIAVRPEDEEDFIRLLFRSLTGKQNSLFRFFLKHAVVTLDDIKRLKSKLDAEFARYRVLASSFNAELSLSDKNEIGLNSWDHFISFDYSRAERVEEISMKYQYMIRHGASNKPEQYIIEMSIRTFFGEFESFLVSRLHDEQSTPPTIRAKVEYVDYIIGKNVFSSIQGWVDSLDDVELNTYIAWMKKHARIVRFWLPNLGYLASLFFSWSLAELWEVDSFSPETVDWIIASLTVFLVTAAVTQYTANNFRSNMEKIGAASNLRLTAGDDKSAVRVAARNRLSLKKAIGAVLSAILAVLLNLISAHIYELFSLGS